MKLKKGLALLLATCCIMPLAACGGGSENNESSGTEGEYNVKGDNKTTIYFTNFQGGVGTQWADRAAEAFAKKYADYNFGGSTKKGVYIEFVNSQQVSVSGITNSNEHILVTERFYTPRSVSNAGELYNLDEIVKDETREGGSLESVIYDDVKGQLKGANGSYYGLPHYEFYGGLTYNYNVFNEQKAFFADDSDTTAVAFKSKFSEKDFKFTNASGKLSKGPDGKANTADDGLPASVEELLVLMNYFKGRTSYYPVTLSGTCYNYSSYLASGLWSSLAGKDQMNAFHSGNGQIEVVKRDDSGNFVYTNENLFKGITYIKKPETEVITLDATNRHRVSDMVAKFYTYAIFEIMEREGYWAPEANKSVSHYGAQAAFLGGQRLGDYKNSAMLCEASYWMTETKDGGIFGQTKALMGKEESDFDVRFMSLPNSYYYSENQTKREDTLLNIANSFLFVNNNITKPGQEDVKEAVIEFVKFMYSEEWLRDFTVTTGSFRSIDYTLTDSDYEKMNSSFYRNLAKQRTAVGSNLVSWASDTEFFHNNSSVLKLDLECVPCNIPGKFSDSMFKMFKTYSGTAEAFGLGAYSAGYLK